MNHARSFRRGYTLLEVLLALGLVALLLACLWSMFGVLNRFFETVPVQAEQAQLLGALVQQISDDLHCAIEDSPAQDPRRPAAGPRPNATSVRRFGLTGTSSSLRIDVLQMPPAASLPASTAGPAPAMQEDFGPRVPELRTVFYQFISPPPPADSLAALGGEPAEATEAEPSGPSGLMRWELDFETPVDLESVLGAALPGTFPAGEAGPAAVAATDALTPLGPPFDQSVTWVPEIAGVTFRYFDGSGWSGSWNSLQRKSLPVAIEVSLQVRPPDSPFPPRPAPAEATGDFAPSGEPDAELLDLMGIAAPVVPTHRFVIYLPGARLRPAIQKPQVFLPWEAPAWPPTDQPPLYSPPAAPMPEPMVPQWVPPAPAARGPSRGRPPLSRPDQWMRSGT